MGEVRVRSSLYPCEQRCFTPGFEFIPPHVWRAYATVVEAFNPTRQNAEPGHLWRLRRTLHQELQPDILIDNPPAEAARGEDAQLRAAVAALIDILEAQE
jgi:hypothetical protein